MSTSPEQITERALRAATKAYLDDRPVLALDYAAEALDADPHCYEALVTSGELYTDWADELGVSQREGALTAILYFDQAISVRPDHAEAYAEKLAPLLD